MSKTEEIARIINDLRICSRDECYKCDRYGPYTMDCGNKLLEEAAEWIELLTAEG